MQHTIPQAYSRDLPSLQTLLIIFLWHSPKHQPISELSLYNKYIMTCVVWKSAALIRVRRWTMQHIVRFCSLMAAAEYSAFRTYINLPSPKGWLFHYKLLRWGGGPHTRPLQALWNDALRPLDYARGSSG